MFLKTIEIVLIDLDGSIPYSPSLSDCILLGVHYLGSEIATSSLIAISILWA